MDFFHCLNRRVDGQVLFLDGKDYARFVHDLYEFNDTTPAGSTYYSFAKNKNTYLDIVSPDMGKDRKKREQLVDIHGWVLMKNHYHLLLSERIEGGISLFLRKLNVGYAKYFNERYARTGTLFQGRTKKILIENDQQFNYILHYIHLNPLDYLKGADKWRIRARGGIKNTQQALEYLSKYRWSSYLDYAGEKNFPSVVTTDFFDKTPGKYTKELSAYLKTTEQKTEPKIWLE